jgi:hypothetical protein
LHYGHDFGRAAPWPHDGIRSTDSKSRLDADFAYLKSQGCSVVRWWLFGDCRATPEFDENGFVSGVEQEFFSDIDAALEIAQKHEMYIIFVLFDYLLCDTAQVVNGVKLFGRAELITVPKKREAFLENALQPLLQRYGQHPSIIAWEVINEPEWAMDIPGGGSVGELVTAEDMHAFVQSCVDVIHQNARQPVTVGSASQRWLDEWKNRGLDFLSFHHYEQELFEPYSELGLGNTPCLIGEFPTQNAPMPLEEFLKASRRGGFAGALVWALNSEDEHSDFKEQASIFRSWSQTIREYVKIQPPNQLLIPAP